jgi:predicted methyltransferase
MPIPANIAAAVADGNRPDADVQRDANRKPAATLAFIGVKPDEQVLELIPGGGYFTRLLSKAVGNGGHVYAWVPGRPANAPADMPDRAAIIRTLAADANYSNLSVVQDPQLKLPAKVQLVFTAQNYHDLHNIPSVDVSAFNKAVFDALEPGGEYVVLDHSAEDASGTRDTATLHRIDAAAVKREVLAAGFQFVAGSDILANAADARTLKIFDPAIRGKTDQFIYKFRKPKR